MRSALVGDASMIGVLIATGSAAGACPVTSMGGSALCAAFLAVVGDLTVSLGLSVSVGSEKLLGFAASLPNAGAVAVCAGGESGRRIAGPNRARTVTGT